MQSRESRREGKKIPDTTQTLDVYKSTLTSQQVDDALKRILQINIPDIIQKQDLFDMVYPVGSIYMSANNVSPATFLGGTWQQIQGQFLLAASGTHPAGSTGGAESHTHEYRVGSYMNYGCVVGNGANGVQVYDYSSGNYAALQNSASQDSTAGNTALVGSQKTLNAYRKSSTGHVSSESNMPPYISVYVWQRTA